MSRLHDKSRPLPEHYVSEQFWRLEIPWGRGAFRTRFQEDPSHMEWFEEHLEAAMSERRSLNFTDIIETQLFIYGHYMQDLPKED